VPLGRARIEQRQPSNRALRLRSQYASVKTTQERSTACSTNRFRGYEDSCELDLKSRLAGRNFDFGRDVTESMSYLWDTLVTRTRVAVQPPSTIGGDSRTFARSTRDNNWRISFRAQGLMSSPAKEAVLRRRSTTR